MVETYMKTTTILAAGMALTSLQAAAQTGDATEIYGRINMALERVHVSTLAPAKPIDSQSREVNNRSVLGFRGGEDIGGGIKVVWQIEGTVAPDTGAGSIAARDTRIGLATPYGTVFAGNWGTAYTTSTQGFDPYYPTTAGYMNIMGNGSAASADNVSDKTSFDRRQQNSLHYWSPKWHGASLRLAHGFNEEQVGNAKPSLTSAAAIWEDGGWYLTAAHEIHHEYQGAGLKDDASKLGAAYQFGATRVAGVVEKIRYQTASGYLQRKSYYASVTHQIGAHGLRFGVAKAADGEGSYAGALAGLRSGADTGALHYTLGYDYTLSRRTGLYAYASHLKNDGRAAYDFAINQAGTSAGAALTATAFGMRHFF
jgi:predicted porin